VCVEIAIRDFPTGVKVTLVEDRCRRFESRPEATTGGIAYRSSGDLERSVTLCNRNREFPKRDFPICLRKCGSR
jgi:hypothetical protein